MFDWFKKINNFKSCCFLLVVYIVAHHLPLSWVTQIHSTTFHPFLPLSVAQVYDKYSKSDAVCNTFPNGDSVRWRDAGPFSNPQSVGLSLVGCPLLLFEVCTLDLWSLKTRHEALTRVHFTWCVTTQTFLGAWTLRAWQRLKKMAPFS